jgi:hypothetical protein
VTEHDDAQDGAPIEDVRDRVEQIQRKRRSGIRWRITKHTAELAIRALEASPGPSQPRKSAKSRRRKRHKRLL